MRSFSVHPTTRLLVWLLLLFAVQSLSGMLLGIAVLCLPVLGRAIIRRGGRLFWRTRWLMISLFVIFSWGVAGEPLWQGVAAPTQDGLVEGATHVGRLLLVLMAVAAFLEVMPLTDLLTATHVLLKPLRRFGFDPDRFVIRLMLVLRYVEKLPRPRDWRTLLDAPVLNVSEGVEVGHHSLCWRDYVITLLASCGVLSICLYRG